MKVTLALLFAISILSCATSSNNIIIPAQQSISLDYPNYDTYGVDLKNKSLKQVQVSVIPTAGGNNVRGFGLGPKGSATVLVELENKLLLSNESDQDVSIKYKVSKSDRNVFSQGKEYISFTLQNKNASAIPLIIPDVMNPNLSPFSKSGVDLKIGQEIYFKANGKKYLLLKVDRAIKDGDIIDVAKLINMRKKELGI